MASHLRTVGDLRNWLDQVPHPADPIEYQFGDPREAHGRALRANWVEAFRGHATAHPISGILQITFERSESFLTSFDKNLGELGITADQRPMQQVFAARAGRSPLLAEYRSAVQPTFDVDPVAVLGPGGRVMAFELPGRVAVDVVIRPRVDALSVRWRDHGDVLARLEGYLREPGMMLTPAFGYFEASKYERQDLLRLVYAFLLEPSDANSAPGPRWRRLLVEPATVHTADDAWIGLEDFRRQP